MSERYNRLFSLTEDQYTAGSPVVLAAGALLKDTATGRIIAQLKIRNISGKIIRAAIVHVYAADVTGNTVCDKEHQYLDLNAARDTYFGQKDPIVLSDNTARSFTVRIKSVIFADGSTWDDAGECWETLPKLQTLFSVYLDKELEVQYRLKHGNSCQFYPITHKDLWFCTCGALNHADETNCNKCKLSLAKLNATSKEGLIAARDARLEEQRRKEEEARLKRIELAKREAELRAARIAKIKKILKIAIPVAIIVAFIFVGIFYYITYQKSLEKAEGGAYRQAKELLPFPTVTNLHDKNYLPYLTGGEYLNRNDYVAAREYLIPLAEADYRNTDELLLEADYLEAHALLNATRFEDAYKAFETLSAISYRDSADMMIECRLTQAKYHEDNKDYRSAMAVYQKLVDIGYKEAPQKLQQATYLYAVDCLESNDSPASVNTGLSTLKELKDNGYQNAHQSYTFYRKQIYDKAILLLEQGTENNDKSKVSLAMQYFQAVDDYEQADDYLLLSKAFMGTYISLDRLWEMRNLDAAMNIILNHENLTRFLEGTWYTKNYDTYFTMDSSHSITYSLPYIDYGDYYKIEKGVFMLYPEGKESSTRNLFKFTIVDWNTVKVYCYKDYTSYTLYRQT